jgi:hypothetical protein
VAIDPGEGDVTHGDDREGEHVAAAADHLASKKTRNWLGGQGSNIPLRAMARGTSFWVVTRSAMSRAREGLLPKVAMVLGGLTALVMFGAAIAVARRSGDVEDVTPLAAQLLAWGAGVLVCFAASMRAFDRDREDGWAALLLRHGVGSATYLATRILGLVFVVGEVVVFGTLAVGLVAMLASPETHTAILAARGAISGLVYGAAFTVVVGPLAVATLGPRGRTTGYLYLLSVLVLPALVARWTGRLVPADWSDLVSVPTALEALRGSLRGTVDPLHAIRALAVLFTTSAIACLWARAQLELHTPPREAT